jgi:hypothetical protein
MATQHIRHGPRYGKPAIELRMTSIALLMREVFPDYKWEIHEEPDNPAMHRLHIYDEEREQHVDFSKRELLTYSDVKRYVETDHRMRNALDKLFDT